MEYWKHICQKENLSQMASWGKALLDVLLFVALFLLVSGLLVLATEPLSGVVPDIGSLRFWGPMFSSELLMLVAIVCSAGILFRVRKIPFSVWGLAFRPVEWGKGLLLAVLLYAVGFSVSLLTGSVQIESVYISLPALLLSLCFFLLVGLTEELMVRGVVMGRMLWGKMPGWAALFLSSFLFSLMHLFNPDFSFLPFLNIFLAGILLGIPYLYSRNLSYSISLHCFWNWLQGPVLGYNVSGTELSGHVYCESLLTLQPGGSPLLNGGSFGFEGSLICTALLIAASVILWRKGKNIEMKNEERRI